MGRLRAVIVLGLLLITGGSVLERVAAAPQATTTLTVDLAGTGRGTVTSSPAGIACTGDGGHSCSGSFASGTSVTLTAAADAGSVFSGWGGACESAAPSCTVTLAQAALVVATFQVPPPTIQQYYHLDLIGSVRAVTDAQGAVIRRQDYAAFGENLAITEAQPLPASAKQPQFAGKARDPETYFDYFGARYYRNTWGRFTTVDPEHVGGNVFDPQSWNAYAYARNNPLRFIDPTGTDYIVAVEGGDPFWFDQGFGDYGAFDRYLRSQGFRPLGGSDRGYILNAAGQIVGEYSYFSRSARVFGGAGLLADRWLKEQLSDMAVGTAIAATGGLAAGALSGGLGTGGLGIGAELTTRHGATRIAGAAASRGGVLSLGEIAAVRAAGRLLTQADGAIVRVLRVGDRFNVVVEGERGIITTFKNLSHKSLDGLARRYGWK